MPKNIVYRTDAIGAFYATHRRKWSDFYPSERAVFEALAMRGASFATVLDVGGAAGGLGDALSERFGPLASYTSLDVNKEAADVGAKIAAAAKQSNRHFIAADICDCPQLAGKAFDLVTALGVADWNLDPTGIVAACWTHVRPGGSMAISLRLTPHQTVCDMARSFQYIWFGDGPAPADAERAPYNMFNAREALAWLSNLTPPAASLHCYGYWGKPSAMAHTPYDRLVFSVIGLRKADGVGVKTATDVHLPDDALVQA